MECKNKSDSPGRRLNRRSLFGDSGGPWAMAAEGLLCRLLAARCHFGGDEAAGFSGWPGFSLQVIRKP